MKYSTRITRLVFSLIILVMSFSLCAQEVIDSFELAGQLVLNYEVDVFQLDEGHRMEVDRFLLEQKASRNFHIEGHTDSDGSNEYNFKLSEKRSRGLYDYLRQKDIGSEYIKVSSFGEEKILYDEQKESAKSSNRRVHLYAYKPVRYMPFSGIVKSADSDLRLKSDITLFLDDSRKTVSTDSLGRFDLLIPIDVRAELYYKAKGYFPYRKIIKLNEKSKPKGVVVKMAEMKRDAVLESTLRFHGGQSVLLDESEKELDILKEVIMENDELCFEIRGHINMETSEYLPKSSFTYGLSIARSIEIYNFLVSHGIAEERMLARGYGNTELKYHYARSYEHQSANRRVEFKVTSCDSTALLENDTVEDLEQYKPRDIKDKYFNELTFQDDIKPMKTRVQRQILYQVKYMKEKGVDPTEYNYLTLLRMYQKRQRGEPDDF